MKAMLGCLDRFKRRFPNVYIGGLDRHITTCGRGYLRETDWDSDDDDDDDSPEFVQSVDITRNPTAETSVDIANQIASTRDDNFLDYRTRNNHTLAAVRYLIRSINETSSSHDMYRLAVMYHQGFLESHCDMPKAIHWNKRAIISGNYDAVPNLMAIVRMGYIERQDSDKTEEQIFNLALGNAQQDEDDTIRLGETFLDNSMEKWAVRVFKVAIRHFKSIIAMRAPAQILEHAYDKTPQDPGSPPSRSGARKYFKMAASNGCPIAMTHLA